MLDSLKRLLGIKHDEERQLRKQRHDAEKAELRRRLAEAELRMLQWEAEAQMGRFPPPTEKRNER